MKILKIAAKDLPLFNGICEIDFYLNKELIVKMQKT